MRGGCLIYVGTQLPILCTGDKSVKRRMSGNEKPKKGILIVRLSHGAERWGVVGCSLSVVSCVAVVYVVNFPRFPKSTSTPQRG